MSKHAQWQETQGNSIPSVLLHCFHAIKASGMHWRSREALRFCREHVGSTGRSGEKTFKHPTLIRDKAFPVVMRYFLLQPILGGNAAADFAADELFAWDLQRFPNRPGRGHSENDGRS
jgi:hypothetical protein